MKLAPVYQGGGEKCAPDIPENKISARSNIITGTWNVRTLREAGKLEELTHEMTRYRWNILGLCEMRWKNIGETSTQEEHNLYYSGRDDKHQQGVGFLIHKNTVNRAMGCRPISSRLITIRLRTTLFNITIIQAYAPTSDYDDDDVEYFYEQLQEVLDQTPKKDILVVQDDWNAKIGEGAYENWTGTCGSYCNTKSNERGLWLLEFASYNDLMLANTFGPHKAPRGATWHSSSVNIAKTRSFPGADIGSDHELVMMTFKLHLKRVKKLGHNRIKFDLKKLKDPEVAEAFHAMIGEQFAALTILDADGTDMETLINTFNTAVTNTASEILGTHRPVKKPWVTADLLDLCDKRRELKKKKKDAEGTRQYRAVNQEIKKGMRSIVGSYEMMLKRRGAVEGGIPPVEGQRSRDKVLCQVAPPGG